MVSFKGNEGALRQRIADLEAKVAALQNEEERTAIALSNSRVGIFDWQLDVRRIYVSPILQDMLGYGAEGMPDNIESWLSLVHSDDQFQADKEVREALVYGKKSFQGLYKMNRKDGATRQFLFRAVIMRRSRADGGDASRVLGSAVDITDLPAILT
jgi:PAS domain S-box-containing protein